MSSMEMSGPITYFLKIVVIICFVLESCSRKRYKISFFMLFYSDISELQFKSIVAKNLEFSSSWMYCLVIVMGRIGDMWGESCVQSVGTDVCVSNSLSA